ncbi:MAG: hypothetical protein ABIK65_14930 [Candidatus Eisenbacteria bacterium]
MNLRSFGGYRKHANPKVLLAGAKAFHYFRELRRHRWKSKEELREIQWRRLSALVRHAYRRVPYYRCLFDRAGFRPDDLRTLDDLRRIPMTDKEEIRADPGAFVAEGIDPLRCRSCFTSGSTGVPLRVLMDEEAYGRGLGVKAYALSECGVRWNDRFVTIAASAGPVLPNHVILPPLSDTRSAIEMLRKAKPDVLYSYPSFLTVLGQYDVSGIRPRRILSQGMNLTEFHRSVIRETFGLEVHDTYGSVEFKALAFECDAHAGLHMITDWAVLEFLKDGDPVRPGETGEIVVTGLQNFAQPLIRYRIGDYGTPSGGSCLCGRSWPLIGRLDGREIDFILLPSGKKTNPSPIYQAVHSEAEMNVYSIAQFQAVQERRDHLTLRIVKGKGFDPDMVERIRARIEEAFTCMGEMIRVDVEYVDAIERGRTGKSKILVSHAK